MIVFGAAETVGSISVGRVSDRIGRLPVVCALVVNDLISYDIIVGVIVIAYSRWWIDLFVVCSRRSNLHVLPCSLFNGTW